VLGLLEPPGRICAGEIQIAGRRTDNLNDLEMEAVHGRMVGAVFQNPLTSLNPLFSVGQQLVETIRLHSHRNRAAARAHPIDLLKQVGISGASERIDSTSSPAAGASAFQLPGHWRAIFAAERLPR
jgi:peptide/nickel transport system ATP-binding protein